MEMHKILSEQLQKKLGLGNEFSDLFSYLYAAIRNGHLAIRIDKDKCTPPISYFFDPQIVDLQTMQENILFAFEKLEMKQVQELLHKEKNFLMLKKHYDLQLSTQQIFQKLTQRSIEALIGKIENIDEEKLGALNIFKKESVLLLSGSPGSGKTMTAGFMVNLIAMNFDAVVYLLAPTGIAAMLLNRSIQNRLPSHLKKKLTIKTGTLHRFIPEDPKRIKIYAHLVIVDEASMIDAHLFEKLLLSIGPKTRLVIIGDPMQLPSVEHGSIFNDLLQIGVKNKVHLAKIFRQEGKEITQFAKAIWKKSIDAFVPFLDEKKNNDSLQYFEENNQAATFYLDNLQTDFTTPEKAFETFHHAKLLTCFQEGFFGVKQLNWRLLELFCKSQKREIFLPIMVTKNQSKLNVYNGDLGVVKVEKKNNYSLLEGISYFWSNDKTEMQSRPMHEVKSFEIAFAMTIHKSQGSEFDRVYLVMSEGAERFGRQVLYTAVTRAKKHLYLFGPKKVYLDIFETDTLRQSFMNENVSL